MPSALFQFDISVESRASVFRRAQRSVEASGFGAGPSFCRSGVDYSRKNGEALNRFQTRPHLKRLGKGLIILLFLTFGVSAVWATDPIYQNYSALYYTVPGNPPPQIDATIFDNENVYSVTYNSWINNQVEFCEPWWNTRFFTNNGSLIINAPFPTNGNFSFQSTGVGYEFDTQTNAVISHVMADTFYNAGTIHCDSILDGNNGLTFVIGNQVLSLFSQTSIGEFIASATNIVNPGEVIVSQNGLMKFTGTNVDLSRGTLTVEGSGANVFGAPGVVGLNTNYWDPSVFLTASTAESAFIPGYGYLLLNNSTPYFAAESVGPSNNIIWAVFAEDTSPPSVAYKVYFGPNSVGPGDITIEWTGSYLDAASGVTFTNYLYLNDDVVLGASTNAAINFNGVPDNFLFRSSVTPLQAGVQGVPGFFNVFPSGSLTNFYAFVNAQLISATTATNASNRNPSGALTNLPGRLEIQAGRHLDLTLSTITGPNYLSIQSPYQFEGSAGARIVAPYADINVGVTNGFLTISNLMQPQIPNWAGTVQAWSTRWLAVDANGVTNDFRVLIVGSQLTAAALAYVQDLLLHGTNSLVLADSFHVLRKLSVDAQNLTLTTNGPGTGATSLDGELNLFSGINWSNSFPNLRNLTNNGVIRVANVNPLTFGSAASPAGAFINHSLLSDNGAIIYVTNFENDGTFTNGSQAPFILKAQTATFTNGALNGGGDVTLSADSLLTSNLFLTANRSLTLAVTNWLTDTGPTNGNLWFVGTNSVGSGFNLLLLPNNPTNRGDLLGTTVTVYAPVNRNVVSTWAAANYGALPLGYTNNVAVGRLVLDASFNPSNPQQNGVFTFTGAAASNALYVDDLELADAATVMDKNGNFSALNINTNLILYFAQARVNGQSVAEKLNGANNGRLRWVPQYAGHFSSVALVYPDGSTNIFNAALAGASDVDSDGDGIPNASDPTPFFTPGQIGLKVTTTNLPPLTAVISWNSIPAATNVVLYSTNSAGPFNQVLTNFVSPAAIPPAGGWPIVNRVYDPVNGVMRFYQVQVYPNSTVLYGSGF